MSAPKQVYEIGTSVTYEKTFNAQDVEIFAQISGDCNPVHLDEEFAADTRFKARVVHGMLVGSLFSTIFGTIFPGKGAIYLGQNLKFTAPIYLGEQLTARVTLVALRDDKPIGTFETICTKQDGTVALSGEATLLLP